MEYLLKWLFSPLPTIKQDKYLPFEGSIEIKKLLGVKVFEIGQRSKLFFCNWFLKEFFDYNDIEFAHSRSLGYGINDDSIYYISIAFVPVFLTFDKKLDACKQII